MLVCIRTCPYQSWQNLTERLMFTLNLALQNFSLADEFEQLISSLNILTDVHGAINKWPNLGGYIDSLSLVMILVGEQLWGNEGERPVCEAWCPYY